jgi:hypothetical protein
LKVFEKRVLKIFGHNRDKLTEGWKKIHIELHIFYFSAYIMRIVKSRRMRWAGQVACIRR